MHFELFLNDLIASKLEAVEMSFIAKIVTFNKGTMRATIRPLLVSTVAASEQAAADVVSVPDIQNVPVELLYAGGFYIRPDYAAGDLVHVSCYGSQIQASVESDGRSNSKVMRFQLNACSVTAGVVRKGATVPAEWASEAGLLIGRDGVYISFDATSVKVKGNLNVDGDIVATGDIDATNVSASGDVTAGLISLKSHTHLSGTPGNPTGPALP